MSLEREDYVEPVCALCGKPGEENPFRPVPRDRILELMKRCGMPIYPADLGISMRDTLDAFIGSREIRDKYLTSSLLWDMGLMEETAQRLEAFLRAEKGAL